MLSNNKEEYYNALDELNAAWKFMYPNDNVTYVRLHFFIV